MIDRLFVALSALTLSSGLAFANVAPVAPAADTEPAPTQDVLILEETPPDETASEQEKADYRAKVREQYEAAMAKSSEWAAKTKDASGELLEKTKETTSGWYESARDWSRDDLGRAGTWQYRIVVITPAELMANPDRLESELNELGEERFECYWVESLDNGRLAMFFKKPGFSYIKALPAKELWRFIPLGGDGSDDAAQ
ncbi:MAG: hypothetical protein ACQKBV_04605 [Puniceicoccales bacterium]